MLIRHHREQSDSFIESMRTPPCPHSNHFIQNPSIYNPTAKQSTRPIAMFDNTQNIHYYTHDANKNVTELISDSGDISAHYEYSPFGATIASSGDLSYSNPFQFSSEFFDSELGLTYYNYRHYNALDGRWINRDPIEEFGGYNIYASMRNNALKYIDRFGLFEIGDITNPIVDGAEATLTAVQKLIEYRDEFEFEIISQVKDANIENVPYVGWYAETLKDYIVSAIQVGMLDPESSFESTVYGLNNTMSRLSEDVVGFTSSMIGGKICAFRTARKQLTKTQMIEASIKIILIPNYKQYLGAWFGINNDQEYYALTKEQIARLSANDYASILHDLKSITGGDFSSPGGIKHLEWVIDVNSGSHSDDGPCGQIIRIAGSFGFTLIAAPAEELTFRLGITK